jgi:hypothetical protein
MVHKDRTKLRSRRQKIELAGTQLKFPVMTSRRHAGTVEQNQLRSSGVSVNFTPAGMRQAILVWEKPGHMKNE